MHRKTAFIQNNNAETPAEEKPEVATPVQNAPAAKKPVKKRTKAKAKKRA